VSVDEPRSWWHDAVFYEIYVRSYADSDGDGIGDLAGISAHLDHLVDLGVDAIWLTPFYPSPMADHGYDVADPRAVDPLFGDLDAFDNVVQSAHARGLRVVIDIVPNHTSVEHAWFRAALAAEPGSDARARYLFRTGRGARSEQPPNNWQSVFGGGAWEQVTDGEWYLHLFAPEQPDLNWRHPDVPADFEQTLRFWLDRGVDGFRIDVAHGLFKGADLPDTATGSSLDLLADVMPASPIWNQPEVHDVYRRWHAIAAEYAHDPVLVGEVWIGDQNAVAEYVRSDELHLAFNFRLLFSEWGAAAYRRAIDESRGALAAVGSTPTWVLGNHDVQRQVSRYGGGDVGEQRARAAVLLLLALPGPVFLYQGEELGLPEVTLPDEALQDPVWERSGHTIRGRDGCRVPLPWSGTAAPYGFSSAAQQPWLPMPTDWSAHTVAAQQTDPTSMLALYRTALQVRRDEPALGAGDFSWQQSDADVLGFVRRSANGSVRCIVNASDSAIELPSAEVLLSSAPMTAGRLAANTAVWLRG
jgi:alpha-glucosidase